MKNHTHVHVPGPTEKMHISVRQQPGFSYPKPVSHIHIREQMLHPSLPFEQPHWDMHERIPGGAPYGAYAPYPGHAHGTPYCPPEMMQGHP
jgi:hypothetical protein